MAGIEKKLASFSDLILNEAKEQQTKILDEVNQEKNKIMQNKEDEFLTEAYEEIQKIVAKYEKSGNEQVLKVEMELKKDLIKKREEIIDTVFDRVTAKIAVFQKTPDYQSWLVSLCRKAIQEIGSERCRIHLAQPDAHLQPVIAAEFPNAEIVADGGNEMIGGIKAESLEKHIFDDFSIAALLDRQRQVFLKISGLSIR